MPNLHSLRTAYLLVLCIMFMGLLITQGMGQDCTYDLTAPTTGTVWDCNTTQTITWTVTGDTCANQVNLFLATSTSNNGSIATGIPNTGSYDWPIPSGITPADDYIIIIQDAMNTNFQDTSGSFIIQCTTTISTSTCSYEFTAPTSGTVWDCGTTQTISWTFTGDTCAAEVNLFLSTSTSNNGTIATGIPNSGSFNWPIPSGISPSDNYQITIQDAVNNTFMATSQPFTIQCTTAISTSTCVYEFTAPTSGTVWDCGSTQAITWTITGENCAAQVNLFLSTSTSNNGSIATGVPNTGTFNWPIPSGITPSTDYFITLQDALNNSVLTTSAPFTIQCTTAISTAACQYTVTSPTTGTVWECGTTQTITWTSTPSGDTCSEFVNIFLGTSTSNNGSIATGVPNTGSYEWPIPSDIISSSDYRIIVQDAVDPNSAATSGTFAIQCFTEWNNDMGDFDTSADTIHFAFELGLNVTEQPEVTWLGSYADRTGLLALSYSIVTEGVKLTSIPRFTVNTANPWYRIRVEYCADSAAPSPNRFEIIALLLTYETPTSNVIRQLGGVYNGATLIAPGVCTTLEAWLYCRETSGQLQLILKNQGSSGNFYIDSIRLDNFAPPASISSTAVPVPCGDFDSAQDTSLACWGFQKTPDTFTRAAFAVTTGLLQVSFSQASQGLKMTSGNLFNAPIGRNVIMSFDVNPQVSLATAVHILGFLYAEQSVEPLIANFSAVGEFGTLTTDTWSTIHVPLTPVSGISTYRLQIVVKNLNEVPEVVFIDNVRFFYETPLFIIPPELVDIPKPAPRNPWRELAMR